MDFSGYAIDHPLIQWYSGHWVNGDADCVQKSTDDSDQSSLVDIYMGEIASSRFSLGVDEDHWPNFGVADSEVEVVMSLAWSKIAFVRNFKKQDWVILACPDARIDKDASINRVALRLWLPASIGIFDGWMDSPMPPNEIRLIETEIRNGVPYPVPYKILATLPLIFKGQW